METNELFGAYLFETNELLEDLDEILLNCEKNGSIDTESINGIFRIMHTVKGSSAMMEFDSMATVAHKIEDLFAYIRENGFDESYNNEMFELMFESSDFLKSELSDIENGNELTADSSSLSNKIKDMLTNISSGVPAKPKSENAELSSTDDASTEVTSNDNADKFSVVVYFDPEAKMENLRAYMLIDELSKDFSNISTIPENPQSASADEIIENGFVISFETEQDLNNAYAPIEQFRYTTRVEKIVNAVATPVAVDSSVAGTIKVEFDPEAKMENLRAFMLLEAISKEIPTVSCTPENPQEASAEEIAKNGIILTFVNKEDTNSASKIIKNFGFVKSFEVSVNSDAKPVTADNTAQENTPATDNQAASKKKNNNNGSASSLINVNLSKLDDLIDLMGEIVITSSMVTSTSFDLSNYDKFQKDGRQLQKLTNELQENIMSIRMMPISNVFNKMHRIVRDMSKKLSKDAELVIIGEETEVDKAIIDCISDPIMHIVRNSMDHGIELPEERVANGKPAKGTVTMTAQNTVGEIIITIEDDGKGFNKSKILAKAKDKGLLKKPENEYTEKEIFGLLFMPGFSTNSQVTEFSGRGVGMDVVKSSIEKIGGTVSLASKEGQGSKISITIPLTLAIVDAMNVTVGKSTITIPIHNIRQTFKPTPENIIKDTHGHEMILIRNDCYPVVRLGKELDMPREYDDLCDGIVLLVETHSSSYCIFVDSLIGEQQIVIKPLPKYLNAFDLKNHGISGCAILGDGSISLILDVATLTNIND